jgi:euchromatic histone-lysine N-methyltransferase
MNVKLLLTAATSGNLNEVKRLLSSGGGMMDANTTVDETEASCLHYATLAGHLNVVQWLLSSDGGKMDANTTVDENGLSCLHFAASAGHLNVVQWLLSSGGGKMDANKTVTIDGSSCLHHAASRGHLHVVQWLLSSDGGKMQSLVNSSAMRASGAKTPLSLAIEHSHTAVFRCLREHGATIPSSHVKRICHVCMTRATSPTQLLCCAACKSNEKKKNEFVPRYCSRACQIIAWQTGHKIECQQQQE